MKKDLGIPVCVEVMKRWSGHGKLMELVTHVLMYLLDHKLKEENQSEEVLSYSSTKQTDLCVNHQNHAHAS